MLTAVVAVMVGRMVTRQLLQTTTLPPGYALTNCTSKILDCSNPDLSKSGSKYYCVNGTINPSGGSSQAGKPCKCAPYNGVYDNPADMTWTVAVGAILAALMAYLIGGNDAANAWATSIGSGAISAKLGMCIGGFMEWAGATALGYGVSGAITRGVAKTTSNTCWACGYCNSKMGLYSVALFSALCAADIFIFIATWFKMPISTTHSIIGGVIGATVVATSFSCINWEFQKGLTGIIASWIISPFAAGAIATALWIVTYFGVIKNKNPRKMALIFMPFEFGLGVFIFVMLVMFKAQPTKSLAKWIGVVAGLGAGALVAALAAFFIVPYVRKEMEKNAKEIHEFGIGLPGHSTIAEVEEGKATTNPSGNVVVQPQNEELFGSSPAPASGINPNDDDVINPSIDLSTAPLGEKPEVLGTIGSSSTYVVVNEKHGTKEEWTGLQREAIWTYRFLLVFVAVLQSFAHGSNDVGNATGPFSGILTSYQNGINKCSANATQWWVVSIGGLFVALGCITFGYRVTTTMGKEITVINYHRGWCMEFAAAITVVTCTVLNLPVSTTHCQVGAIVILGIVAVGYKHVKISLFFIIFATWVVTVPVAGLVAAAFMAAIRPAVRN